MTQTLVSGSNPVGYFFDQGVGTARPTRPKRCKETDTFMWMIHGSMMIHKCGTTTLGTGVTTRVGVTVSKKRTLYIEMNYRGDGGRKRGERSRRIRLVLSSGRINVEVRNQS